MTTFAHTGPITEIAVSYTHLLVGQKVKNIIPEGFAERLIADGTRSAAEALAQQILSLIHI